MNSMVNRFTSTPLVVQDWGPADLLCTPARAGHHNRATGRARIVRGQVEGETGNLLKRMGTLFSDPGSS
jgi:hypothetical protein